MPLIQRPFDPPERRDTRPETRPADALPTTPYSVPVSGRSNAAARSMLRRLVQGEDPPTQAMTVVERLAGSPYADPAVYVAGPDANARKALDFALDLAEAMFRFGAGALQVETSIIAVMAAFGLDGVEVDITNQSVVINYSTKDQTPTTVLRVVRSWTDNYAGLTNIHRLVSDIAAGGVSRTEAVQRLDDILRRPKPFPRWMVTAAFGVFSAAIVGVVGGTPLGSLIGLVSCILIDLVSRKLGQWRVPEVFAVSISAGIVTFIAMFVWWLDAPVAPALVVVGGILLLLPTGRLVSATQDAINGFPVTAAGRYLSAGLVFAALVAGIAVALIAGTALGVPELDVLESSGSQYPWPVVCILVFVAVAMICIAEQTAPKMIIPTSLVAVAGYLVFISATATGVGYRLAPALAAIVIGALARVVALRMRATQLVVAVPALLFLYPGLAIFRAMYDLTIEAEVVSTGVVGLFNASTVVLGIAVGVVLGDNLVRPFTRRFSSDEQQRNRRR
ncbi:threonine/serine exporter family protein [Arthrobacter echini]|uniref:Threonine/serine exporter family protein n=1 Tax=Arthrobacter echini TaxID=1529066 RepID=A0A4S5E5B1_9MICC|nr:threonine/serine exporter family protein [Arthrobacter echini]THJ66678.1 threonine/serine exporter family protein [Arthrobacter echini]